MTWTIRFAAPAQKSLLKLDRQIAARITKALDKIAESDNPRSKGIAMVGKYAGHWRYRVGDHRIIARIEDQQLIILVVEVGHRREVYR